MNCDRRIADNVQDLREHTGEKRNTRRRVACADEPSPFWAADASVKKSPSANSFRYGSKHGAAPSRLRGRGLSVEFCASPHAAAQGADALTVHLALTDATKHIVNDDILNAVNPGAYIINTSRGEMVMRPRSFAPWTNEAYEPV